LTDKLGMPLQHFGIQLQ